jgi:tRNA dimethylallyltransferase
MSRPRVLAIVGPTGTGKTELAAALARRTGAEIIGADSMQVYRGMDIGTAKPSRALRGEIPHHLIDVVDPDEPMSAGRYAEQARAAAHSILARGRPVLLCGGSGLYTRAFASGLIGGVESNEALRARLEALPDAELLAELHRVDPQLAQRIHPHNRVRWVRALEIAHLRGEGASWLQAAHGFSDRPFDVIWLGLELPRALLWERLRARVGAMFAEGWVDEVRALHAAGFGPELRPLRGIGYREIGALLAGRVDERTAREQIWMATRRFAKRQRTWFRAEAGMRWLDAREPENCLARALELAQEEGELSPEDS